MKTKYLDFLKLNENRNSVISLSEVEKVFKTVFDETKVSSVKSLYDLDEESGETKLIISINNLFYDDTNILYTKFVFLVDKNKTKLQKNKMFYLYDINCNFKEIIFNDSEELQIELNKILKNEMFGKDIKDLSDISVSMSSKTNEWFSENGIEDLSLYSIKYQPLVDNIPCDSLFFRFEINVDDTRFIELNIRKNEEEKQYKLSFNEGDWFHDVEIENINDLIKSIGKTIKNYII